MTNPVEQTRLSTHKASEAFVASKTQSMMEIGVWPPSERMNFRAWLANFKDKERPYAFNLLNVFIYYNERLVDALFRAAVQRLSVSIVRSATSVQDARNRWRRFLASVQVTYVQGEDPNPTDSGLLFARKARQVLDINEKQITEPKQALSALLQKPDSPVMIVDDFVGSGNQMIETWHRSYISTAGQPDTFAGAVQNGASVYFVPIVATQYGLEEVKSKCSGLTISPAHVLDDRYSLTAPDSVLWPDDLKSDALSFLYNASRRAGIVDECEFGWRGFHDLALALAFHHSVPDSTLPLFFWNRNGWKPLIART